jgi:hypothetical protein
MKILEPDFPETGTIFSLRNYLMKYWAKTLVETIPDWTVEELVLMQLQEKKYRTKNSNTKLQMFSGELSPQKSSSSITYFGKKLL